jgi:hypothetical protein
VADIEQFEQALRRLGVRRADELAAGWAGHGFTPDEMVAWLHAGVGVDEPHIAAAMVAAEWSPAQAARRVVAGEQLTFLEAVRAHPNGATYARELRWMAG